MKVGVFFWLSKKCNLKPCIREAIARHLDLLYYIVICIGSCTDSPGVKDPTSDAGGPRFESQTGRVTGEPTPKPLEG